jgi:hypothetical protein
MNNFFKDASPLLNVFRFSVFIMSFRFIFCRQLVLANVIGLLDNVLSFWKFLFVSKGLLGKFFSCAVVLLTRFR